MTWMEVVMEKTSLLRAKPLGLTDVPLGDVDQEVRDLLTYIRSAVDDIRAQLAAKHKSHYTVEEIADMFGRSAFTIRRWIGTGRIKAIRVEGTGPKGRLLVPRDQLDVLIGEGMAAAVPDAVAGT
jgi:excisionase family DNA binding protein